MTTTGYSSKTRKIGGWSKAQVESYESASRIKHEDKNSGSYERHTTKMISSGKIYVEKSGVQVSVKNEFKGSSTVKTRAIPMEKRANKRGQDKVSHSAPKAVATTGYISSFSMTTTGYSSNTRKLGGSSKAQVGSYERASRIKHEDKKSGSYERHTTKEMVSSGKFYVEKGSVQVGVKNEFKRSSTLKIRAIPMEKGTNKRGQESNERTSRIKHEEKKSGSYERYTTKEMVSKGNFYGEKRSGQVVVKNELKRSSTATLDSLVTRVIIH